MIPNYTLIVPTYNRPQHLLRLLDYVCQSVPIVVVDSSVEGCGDLIDTNECIKYLHTPELTFPLKILRALDSINTDFVQICADDDFPVLSTSKIAVEMLRSDGSLSTVSGLTVAYFQQKERVDVWPRYIDKFNWSNVAACQMARFNKVFENYYQFFYAIHRTKNLKSMFSLISTHSHKRGWEVDVSLMSSLIGSMIVVKTVGSVREAMPTTHQINPNPTVNSWISVNINTEEFQKWENAYVDFLVRDGSSNECLEILQLLRTPSFDTVRSGIYWFAWRIFAAFFLRSFNWPPKAVHQKMIWLWDKIFLRSSHSRFLHTDEWARIKIILRQYGCLDSTKYES